MRTSATLTLNWVSTALLDLDLVGVACHLEARRRSLVAQLRRLLGDQRTADDLLDLSFRQHLHQTVERVLADHEERAVHHVVDVDRQRVDRLQPGSLRAASASVWLSRLSTRSALPSTPSLPGAPSSSWVLWLLDLEAVDDDDLLVGELARQRRLQRVLLLPPRQVLRVAVRDRAVDRAAAAPLGVADVARRGRGRCPSARQSFCRSRRPRARVFTLCVPLPQPRQVGLHRLVDQVLLVRVAEDLLGEARSRAPAGCRNS